MQTLTKIYFVLFLSVLTYIYFIIYYEKLQLKSKFSAAFNNKVKVPQSCGRFPKNEHITVDNPTWQVLELPRGFVKILNAYLDTRQNQSVVRLNVNSMQLIKSDILYCQFWFDDVTKPKIVKATEKLLMWVFRIATTNEIPYLIECPFPFNGTIPTSVSLVASPCDHAENNLKILNAQPVDGVKKRFGVCSKQVTFENRDFTPRFIEWVHMMRILGAEKIHFFYKHLHPDMFDVVQYFEDQGMVEAWPYFDPPKTSDSFALWSKRITEINTLTDCFYRVKNLYDYVAILDFDEVIMPRIKKDRNWEDIFKRVKTNTYCDAYVFQNVYYPEIGAEPLEEAPKYMYMLQHIQRSQNFSNPGNAVKSIVGTKRTLTIHNHSPRHCINKNHTCTYLHVPEIISQNSHYRRKMDPGTTFNITVKDITIWKFKEQLIKSVYETLKATRFNP